MSVCSCRRGTLFTSACYVNTGRSGANNLELNTNNHQVFTSSKLHKCKIQYFQTGDQWTSRLTYQPLTSDVMRHMTKHPRGDTLPASPAGMCVRPCCPAWRRHAACSGHAALCLRTSWRSTRCSACRYPTVHCGRRL